jgi:formamidopyrimidine-DNA glycosylase
MHSCQYSKDHFTLIGGLIFAIARYMEGPSLVILKEALESFKGKKIKKVSGTTTQIEPDDLINQTVVDFKSWGKHLLIQLKKF